jgi:heme exporter protein B
MLLLLFKRELRLHLRSAGEVFGVPALYALAVSFYVMSQPHGTVVRHGAVAMLWVAALLSLALVQYRLYERDDADGTLEQWGMLPLALEWIVAVKCLAHWLIAGAPLAILSPLLLLLLGVEQPFNPAPMVALALGTLALIALGSMAGACCLRLRAHQMLTLLLLLPLSVPILIFGAAAASPGTEGSMTPLLAYTLFCVPLATASSAVLLRYAQRG